MIVRWFFYIIVFVSWWGAFLHYATASPDPHAVMNGSGPYFVVWLVSAGAVLGAIVGFLIAFGLLSDPEEGLEAFEIIMLPFILCGSAMFFFWYVRELMPFFEQAGDTHFLPQALVGTDPVALWLGRAWIGVFGYLGFLLLLLSPAWILVAIWGFIKLVIFNTTRGHTPASTDALLRGKDVSGSQLANELGDVLNATRAPWWSYIPGLRRLYNFHTKTNTWWANQQTDKLRAAERRTRAAADLKRARGK